MKKFINWFPKVQAKFKAQTSELEAKIKQKHLQKLPSAQIISLSEKIDSLPIPYSYLKSVKFQLSQAITRWQEEENAPNSLVVLGSSIEPFAQIFNEVLADWQQKDNLLLKSLSWSSRPADYSTIKFQLSQEINSSQDLLGNSRHFVFIIPDLNWCFLRCVDGLDTIEYLQGLLFTDRSQFWLIGCNISTWEYLDVIGNFSHYFQQTFHLPKLKAIEIKEWLTPITDTLEFRFSEYEDNQSDENDLTDENEDNWESLSQKSFFQHLATISLGLSHVASRLWLLSLGMEEEETSKEQKQGDKQANDSAPHIILQKTVLPNLPQLTKDDLYLLFSLGLHGKMTLSELTISLGEEEIKVQNQVQILCNSGVVEHRNKLLTINPAYYPQIQKYLSRNNFFLGDK
jgi:hypothetical protein